MRKLECAVIIIKPCEKCERLCKEVERLILKNKLLTICKINKKYEEEDLFGCLEPKCKKKKYLEYMTSGNLTVYLVRGENAISKAKMIKTQIRNCYKVKKSQMKNLIHSTDEGNEFFYQFKSFFPNINLQEFTGFADLNVPYSDQAVHYLQTTNNVPCVVALVGTTHEFGRQKIKFTNIKCLFGTKYTFRVKGYFLTFILYGDEVCNKVFGKLRDMIVYTRKHKKVIALDEIPNYLYCADLFKEINKMEIDAALVASSESNLFQLRNIQELFDYYGMIPIFGSGKMYDIGSITTSQDTYEKLFMKNTI